MKPQYSAMAARRAAVALVALVALVTAGCSKKLMQQLVPNQAPEVRLTAAPVTPDSLRPDFYAYTMQWAGYDPDGRVDHFVYAVDPPDPYRPPDPAKGSPADTFWHATTKNEQTFFFSAERPIVPIDPQNAKARSPHVFAIYAVDNQGTRSVRPAARGFFSFTQAPIVRVTEPPPTGSFTPTVTPTVRIKWEGQDPDGQFTTKPVRWAFRLFGQSNPDFPGIDFISFALTNSDSLRKFYAPTFPGWTHVGAETTSWQFRNLVPQSTYLFVVTGFDEAGAYDPVFSQSRNMLKFSVTFAGTFGPLITMYNQFFFYRYDVGGWDPRESRWFWLEVPADLPVAFNWLADAPPGAEIRRYRWVMDLVDLADETPRSNEHTDWYHWSAWSRGITSATVGPFPPRPEDPPDPDSHLFYIEAEDNNGLKSLGIINFRGIRSSFEKNLLFVDDTRLSVDMRSGGGLDVGPPSGVWPTAAELDTFLFAKGGVPWRSYPSGTNSTPGIFNGYQYDTIGTRGISADGIVPLSLLGRYQHVVWYTDGLGANQVGSPIDRSTPITALRLVSSPGRPVVLATYITQGGKVWLSGGGAALATLIAWNKPGSTTFEYTARDLELVPGRMMYDFVHWREGIKMAPAAQARKFGSTTFGVGPRPGRGWPGQPDYSVLPNTLLRKGDAPVDPPPPLRFPDSFFYRTTFDAEFISRLTFIREDYDPDPDRVREISTLDTLYLTAGGTATASSPVMTYYHGLENQPIVFSGFNFWYWRRTHCIALVDFVLQNIWGLTRDPVSREPMAPASARRAAP